MKFKLSTILLAATTFALVSSANAATFTVNSKEDGADATPGNGVCETATGNGVCTLRAALQEAANGDTINFSVTGTIVPATVLPITTGVTIVGPGASNLQIDGQRNVGIFNVNGTGIAVSISGLTLTRASNADTGAGAIENGAGVASLSVADCVFLRNEGSRGGAISNGTTAGTLNIANCAFTDNSVNQIGGAIYNPNGRAVTMTNSTFTGNSATGLSQNLGQGGALYHSKVTKTGETIPVTITGCTFVANVAGKTNSSGGDITAGGAIYYSPSGDTGESLTVTNCTFTNNASTIGQISNTDTSAAGGAIYAGSSDLRFQPPPMTITITGSTFTGNSVFGGNSSAHPADGGAVFFGDGGVSISSSTFSGNTATDNGRRQSSGAAIFYAGIDPRGLTLTDCAVTNNTADAGSASNFPVSIGGGLYCANTSAGADSTPAPVVITRSSFTGNKCTGIFDVGGGIYKVGTGPITIADSTISNNSAPTGFSSGGGLYAGQGALSISNTTMDGNVAGDTATDASFGSGGGGAIYASGTSTSITNSKLTNNKAAGNGDSFGGAIQVISGTVSISATTLSGNSVNSVAGEAHGGAIQNGTTFGSTGPNTTVKDSTISGNSLSAGGTSNPGDAEGGAVSIIGNGSFALRNSTVSGNIATATGSGMARGGGLYLGTAPSISVSVDNSTIASNTTSCSANSSCGLGGGIFSDNTAFTIGDTIIALNTAGGSGPDESGPITSLGYNLVGNGDGSSGFGTTGDQVGTGAAPIDPKLGPLDNYGGPTLTLALLNGSPAIDMGDPNFDPTLVDLPNDQRGRPRVRGPRLDIGAYEAPAPPIINVPADGTRTNGTPTISGTASAGDTVTLTVTGTGGTFTFSTTADSNGNFSVTSPFLSDGSYTVTGTARFGNEAPSPNSTARNFSVDTTPPVISNVPANMTVEATSKDGSVVTYPTSTADDNIDGPVPVSCAPASGSTFALGTTMVTCSASDQVGNTSRASFNVTVQDTTPPAFSNVPSDITAEATSKNGAVVSYNPPTASDTVSGNAAVTCSPASGSTFALGTTKVTCTATDNAGNAGTAFFKVTVSDTTRPVITVPDNIIVFNEAGQNGAHVTFSVSATDTVDGNVTATPSQASGSLFPVGTTTVTVTATDKAGNTATKTFLVAVLKTQFANISTRLPVGTGDNVGIAGFILRGTTSKRVIVRALGPSVTVNGAPVPNGLQDPTLELRDADKQLIANNDNYRSSSDRDLAEFSALGFAPGDERESVVIKTLSPGNYTAIIQGAGGASGNGLVEVYVIDDTGDADLGNISTRGLVQTEDNVLIGGVIVKGGDPKKVLIRGIGPELTAKKVANALQDPTLELRDANGQLIQRNDNWEDTQKSEIEATHMQPTDPRESAIVKDVTAGNYTAILRGAGDTTGVALVELYSLDQ